MERERQIEFLIGVCFIIFLILIVVLILNVGQEKETQTDKNSNQETQTVINNYYYENTYNSPKSPYTGNVVYKDGNYNYVVYKKDSDYWDSWNYEDYRDYYENKDYWEWRKQKEQERENEAYYDDFSSSGIRKKTKSGTSYVDIYTVHVRNEDSFPKYFKVVFLFEDHSDSEDFDETETMVKYIMPGETRKFVFRDVHFERDHYDYWDYRVYSQDNGFE